MSRPSKIYLAMETAKLWATASTCPRLSVGAVLTDPTGRILMTGFNGAPAGMAHCDHGCTCGHEFSTDPNEYHLEFCTFRQPCTTACHAEENVYCWCARKGVTTEGSWIFITASPCNRCARSILAAGTVKCFYGIPYRDTSGLDMLSAGGVEVVHLPSRED